MNKKGFTLIEIVITLTLLGVVGVFITSFITPLFKISDGIYNKTEATSMTNTIYNQVIEELRELSDVVGIDNSDTLLYKIPNNNDVKSFNGTDLANDLFPERNITVTFEEGTYLIFVNIKIYDASWNEIASTQKTVAPPNYIK
ncbi:MAG: prepilin-type N-terminal cleavage/methylation domain-containing protein [Sedimentibacter sp.]